MLKRIASILGVSALVVGLVGCGGGESSQSSDELRDEIITLLFAAAANGASSDGSDPASVVLKALEDNPDLLTSLETDQLADLRDALVAPEVTEGGAGSQEAAPDTLAENETDMPSPAPAPDTAAPAPAPDESAAPGGGSGASAGTIVSIPPLTVPNINWGAVTDILNGGSNDTNKISIPTLSPISVPVLSKIKLSDLKIVGRSPLVVTFNITEASADIKTVAYAWTGKGLTGSGDARFVEKVSDTVSTWQVGSMLDNTTSLRIIVTDRAGVVASFVHQF